MLSERLRAELAAIGQNGTWLAKQIGVSKQTAYKWLDGALPTLAHLMHIASVLDIPVASLLTDAPCSLHNVCGALDLLPPEQRAQVRDFLVFTLERSASTTPERQADVSALVRRLKADPAFSD